MDNDTQLRIDIDAVLRQRAPRLRRWMPRAMVRALERFVHQDEMNRLLEATAGLRGADFCRGVLSHLGVSCSLQPGSALPAAADSRVIFVSNHPLGGLDGMALIALLAEGMQRPVKAVVNDLLMAVEPLSDVFLPVNKHGRQNRADGIRLEEAFAAEGPLLMFPAGLCSRRGADGTVADLDWQKMFVNHAIRHQRDIIPLHFSGRNSNFFYNFASLRRRLGIRFNIEMTRLPAEVFLSRGKCFSVAVGDRIPWQSLRGGAGALQQAAEIRRIVYTLSKS